MDHLFCRRHQGKPSLRCDTCVLMAKLARGGFKRFTDSVTETKQARGGLAAHNVYELVGRMRILLQETLGTPRFPHQLSLRIEQALKDSEPDSEIMEFLLSGGFDEKDQD